MTIITCPMCGAKNRVDPARARLTQPVCGKCHTTLVLPPSSTFDTSRPINLTDATFDQTISAAPVPVLVDCWAPWCGPCRAVAPIIEELAAESAGRYLVAKLNTDENPDTARTLSIHAIPTLLIYKNGKQADRIEGIMPKPALYARLQTHL